MSAVVITPKSEKELAFVSDLLSKLGIAAKVMSEEDVEDLGLMKLMKTVDRSKKVSREQVMKKLTGK